MRKNLGPLGSNTANGSLSVGLKMGKTDTAVLWRVTEVGRHHVALREWKVRQDKGEAGDWRRGQDVGEPDSAGPQAPSTPEQQVFSITSMVSPLGAHSSFPSISPLSLTF